MAKKQAHTGAEEEKSRATIRDVARHSGVSIATVSRVLNGQEYVTEETREKVMQTVQELEYIPRQRTIEQPRLHNRLIGLTSVTVQSGEYTEILAGVTEALHAHNAYPVICPVPRRHDGGMPLLERYMVDMTAGGLVLGSPEDNDELLQAQRTGFPVVVIYPDQLVDEHIPVVTASHLQGARIATRHLLALGHTRLGLVSYGVQNYLNDDRRAGFLSALFAANIAPDLDLIYESKSATKRGGYEAARTLLERPKPPTALLAFNDQMGAGILQAAQELDLKVPGDLSVVGFQDVGVHQGEEGEEGESFASVVTPELTTMRQPLSEMGRIGVDMLMRLINGQKLDVTRVELTPRLIIRASTGVPGSAHQQQSEKRYR